MARAPDTTRHPRDIALAWHRAGAAWLHVTDIDRAYGTGENAALLGELTALSGVRVQVGGSLTSPETIRGVLGGGAARVIVGARAAAHLDALLAEHGAARVGLALDTRAGEVVALDGTVLGAPVALAERARAAGLTTLVVRDLLRDGRLAGPDLAVAVELEARGFEVLVAGGVAALDHLRAARDAGLSGVIVGRALLEGRFTVEEALACCG